MEQLKWLFEMMDHISGPARHAAGALQGLVVNINVTNNALKDQEDKAKKTSRAWTAFAATMRTLGRGSIGGIRWVTGQLSSLARMARYAGAAGLGGLALLGRQVVRVGSETETTQNTIAGMLRASGGTRDWGESMAFAGRAMAQIRADAARLPGTDADFLTIFRTAMPAALGANMHDMRQIIALTNQIGAVGISSGIDAEQIGRDTQMMFQGRAGAQVRTWQMLAPNIRRAAEGLHLSARSAEQFNHLRPEQRVQLMTAAAGQYREMIEGASHSWETVSSTTRANAMGLFRIATAGLFGHMTTTLGRLNSAFDRNHHSAEDMARTVGDRLGQAFDFVVTRVERLWRWMQRIRHGAGAGGLLRGILGARGTTVTAGIAGLALGIPGLGIFVSVLAAASARGVTLSAVLERLRPITVAVAEVLDTFFTLGGQVVHAVLPPLIRTVERVTPLFLGLADRVGPRIVTLFEQMATTAGRLVENVIPSLISIFEEVLLPALESFANFVESITPGTFRRERRVRERAQNGDVTVRRATVSGMELGGWSGTRGRGTDVMTQLAGGGTRRTQAVQGQGLYAFGGRQEQITETGRIGDATGRGLRQGVERSLGIHSPSKVMEHIGMQVAAGLRNGVTGGLDRAATAPGGGAGVAGGGHGHRVNVGDVHVHVEGGAAGMDPQAMARSVRDALVSELATLFEQAAMETGAT